ncbi:flagellar motor switch protein FliG [Rhodobacter veldkampii DSM 11550]|uniref:Flagellar motor switch protein FliG n=1 Tax=Phaeovulum veldkampii DSM 11550 TaxID=1185920 RepID=A0A2T4JLE7_9RHOB|nr:FliG C-terminal domain-containing protein [Phaeovulum veldkampii]MBK5947422.1 flagellar motor switch protein FliG [Phaeovulum veldkampii DSM 11550]NCU19660.1 flagellar motor switch protein FliG [Candidatus Falkowbacteria bacterium]PTE18587.1 flagellar motor switch protein FliG [Phaeovulum veldkampii DSM 11550]
MAPARGGATPGVTIVAQPLTRRQKAAIIVRLLLAEGAQLPLAQLPDDLQTALTEQIASMKMVDRDTLSAVIEEFCDTLEAVGLAFPGGLDGALGLLDGHLSASAANRLRRMAGAAARTDPWDRIAALPAERLVPVLEEESTEVGAVMLSKLGVAKAADLLGRLPGDRARRIAYAVSLTGNVAPEMVLRIGQSLVTQLEAEPPKAFEAGPVERVGAILNFSAAATRDSVLEGLEQDDAAFAQEVRRAIFTFANIPDRVEARDIPKVLRAVDQALVVTALAGARGADAATAEFILANISQRLAAGLRDEVTNRGKVREKDAEEAMASVVAAIRTMEAAGELTLITAEEDG